MSKYLYRLFNFSLTVYEQIFSEYENGVILTSRLVVSELLISSSVYQGRTTKKIWLRRIKMKFTVDY